MKILFTIRQSSFYSLSIRYLQIYENHAVKLKCDQLIADVKKNPKVWNQI